MSYNVFLSCEYINQKNDILEIKKIEVLELIFNVQFQNKVSYG